MAPPRYKATGCFRFFIFFLIFIPAVYFGAAYFRGEDGLQMIKDFFHKIGRKTVTTSSGTDVKTDTYKLDDCKTELKKLQEENDEMKRQLREKDNEISRIKSSAH
ncbi:MAG: hypothetical protein ABIQ02_03600 [Saprospiraceae bacterium]